MTLGRRRVFPEPGMYGNGSYLTKISSGKSKKKYRKKPCKKCLTIAQRSEREVNELKTLINDFLSHKCSVAGIPYIVRSQSRWRRMIWFAAVLLITGFMGYMTFNVVQEYLKYPKMLMRDGKINPKLQFPAVTLCSLNPLINITTNRSSVFKLIKLKELLETTHVEPSNRKLREDCYIHPLCQWSWFNETCRCVKFPCATEFCLAENSSHCACSNNLCSDFKDLISCKIGEEIDRCMCSNDVEYDSSLEMKNYRKKLPQYDTNWEDVGAQVQEVMDLIRKAETYDLVDIEDSLMPTVSDLLEYGIKFDNLVISCSFDGKPCFRENFTVLYHAAYGRCYMFNYLGYKQNTEKPVVSYSYGSSSGLRLILHVRKQDSIDILNPEVGARIVIHDPYSLPFIAEYGINVRPHDMSAIEVKQSVINRLQYPYGNCVLDGKHLKFQIPSEQPYSILGCQKACRNYYLSKACKCTKRNFITGSVFYMKTTQTKFCKLENPNDRKCMVDIISQIETGKILCDCRPSCSETVYSTTVSSSDLNENYYKAVKSIRTFHTDKDGVHKTINNSDPSNLMVGVKVYYSTFQVDNDNEQASYSWETLIANVGGNLGFFMGLTLVTFMEVLEFFWDLSTATLKKYMDSKGKPDKSLQMFPDSR